MLIHVFGYHVCVMVMSAFYFTTIKIYFSVINIVISDDHKEKDICYEAYILFYSNPFI